MSTLGDLVRGHTGLDPAAVAQLHRLVGEWQLLADLSFADLLLWVRVRDDLLEEVAGHLPQADGGAFLSVAQVRPATAPTVFQDDRVGAVVTRASAPMLADCWDQREVLRQAGQSWGAVEPVELEAVPVRHGGRVVAVLGRCTAATAVRQQSRLESAYVEVSAVLMRMVAEGRFPTSTAGGDVPEAGPRVGDGIVLVGVDDTVTFASPNAQSAFRRLGVAATLLGSRLGDTLQLLVPQPAVALAPSLRHPGVVEVEGAGAVVQVRVVPLMADLRRRGALVLVRDLTEVRHRDRQLLTKDATIREIHHRVKNNLQTVAALLRLQARRTTLAEAREALLESVRRVAAIAYVHETLSTAFDETVAFDAVADHVVALVREVSPAWQSVRLRREGSFGLLGAEVATPLALVLSELVQNALEHGFPADEDGAAADGLLVVRVQRSAAGPQEDPPARLVVDVDDDGVGLPATFRPAESTSLGLQIVRALTEGELGGTLELRALPTGGTRARVDLPLPVADAEAADTTHAAAVELDLSAALRLSPTPGEG